MKIEIGESLMYSWLRHVKGCQIVQNNWKVSPTWIIRNENQIETILDAARKLFNGKYDLFGKNKNEQFLEQGEADAIGIDIFTNEYYMIDIAFHRGELNYGNKIETVSKVLEKCLRSAMCLYGYLNVKTADIIFASPKIGPTKLALLESALKDLQTFSDNMGLKFKYILYCNDDFAYNIINPVIKCGADVNDTSELFLRSIQLVDMTNKPTKHQNDKPINQSQASGFTQYKIGQLASNVLRNTLENNTFTSQEISKFLDGDYSKKTFNIQYPLLVKERNTANKKHYYSSPLTIGNDTYYLCNEWYEQNGNNDRPFLEEWLLKHL